MGKSPSGAHENYARESEFEMSSDRNFGLVFATFFALVSVFSYVNHGSHWPWWLAAATVFVVAAFIVPSVMAPLNRAWTKLGLLLFTVVSPIALGAVFYVCIAPLGLLLRLCGKDLLSLRRHGDADSYWIRRQPPGPARDTLNRQF